VRFTLIVPLAIFSLAAAAAAQTSTPASGAQPSIATVPIEGVSLSGSLSVANGRATIGNDGSITAGDKAAHVELTRGGSLDVCASTKLQLSTDKSIPGGGLMLAIDRGAFEAHYTTGRYSDVILTPDLRILISPPGRADVSVRVNEQGDTCVANHGKNAPYVLATSLFDDGAYRIQPNQRVLFEHGSLGEVVDNEQEPCGCPPSRPVSVASTGVTGGKTARPGESVAARENPFPLAESEGLKPAPGPAAEPRAPIGETQTEVQVPLAYNGRHPEALPPAPARPAKARKAAAPEAARAEVPAKRHRGLFGAIGHFFRRLFGGK
jgi:hypothetical protein